MALRRGYWKGCLFGCLGLIVVAVLFSVGMGIWLFKKGQFESETTILAEEADYYARIYLQPQDRALIEFFSGLSAKFQRHGMANPNLPEFFRTWQRGQTKRDIIKMLPLEVELTGSVAANPEGGQTHGQFNAAIGFSLYNNLAKVAFFFIKREAKKEGKLYNHNGRSYVGPEVDDHARDPFFFTLADNFALIADSHAGMSAMLDSLRVTEPVSHAGDRRLAGVDLTAPVYGFLKGKATAMEWADIWVDGDYEYEGGERQTPLRTLTKDAERVGFDLKIESAGLLTGHLILEMHDRSQTRRNALEQALNNMFVDSDLQFQYKLLETDSGFEIQYQISGFHEALDPG